MSDELAKYQSSSNPGKYYHIIKGSDGVIYCDCPSWKMSPAPKDCKHLRSFNATFTKPNKNQRQPKKPDYSLQNAIDAEVRNLS